MRRKLLLRALLAVTLALGACQRSPSPDAGVTQAPSVTIANPRVGTAGDWIALTGTIAPSASVDLVAKVSGTILAKGFADGSFVHEGQMLFQIDPETYAAQLDGARAKEVQARAEYERQTQLLSQNVTSRANVDTARSTLAQATASRKTSEISMADTVVRAPFSGWIGAANVDVGAFVGTSTIKLATLQRIDPVFVDFTLGERQLLALNRQSDGWQANGRPVAVGRVDQSDFPYHGTLDFTQKGLDSATGTQVMRAVVANGGTPLLPGMTARVRIATPAAPSAILVPETVIQSDPLGDYVLVVDADGRVQRRDVTIGAEQAGQRVVTGGLSPRDWVVVDGLANVRIGQRAEVQRTVLP